MAKPHIEKTGKIAVLGAGSWGTALADHLGRKGYPVTLWVREAEVCRSIETERINDTFLPGVELSENITPTNEIEAALKDAPVVVCSIPTNFISSVMAGAAAMIERGAIVVNTSKGIEEGTTLTGSRILAEAGVSRVTVLSGPSFAKEVAAGFPCAVVAASEEISLAREVQEIFSSPLFRAYTSTDVVGVELGGALKNVMALAAGIADGLGLGLNARAALITRGLAEMARLGVAMGAHLETFSGLSGLGDLVLTCTGDLSRNRTVGMKLGSGEELADIVSEMKMVAEGVKTAKGAKLMADREDVEMPITEEVNRVLYESKGAREAAEDLMTRALKSE